MVRLEGRYIPTEEIRPQEPYFEYGVCLIKTFNNIESLCDMGCANGQLLAYLDIYNINVLGIEYFHWQKKAANIEIQDKIIIHDLRKPIKHDKKYKVVNCTEVGEHIDFEYVNVLIDNIKKLASKYVITTWSKDGGDPHGQHLNPMPYVKYRKLFIDNGFKPNLGLTEKFINESLNYKKFYYWWRESLMIWEI